MENHNILLDAIALLIFEQSIKSDFDSSNLIKKVIKVIEDNTNSRMLVSRDSLTDFLKNYLKEMLIDQESGIDFNIDKIVRDISGYMVKNIEDGELEIDDYLSNDLRRSLTPPTDYDECLAQIKLMRKRLANIINSIQLKNIAKMFYAKVNNGNIRNRVSEIANEITLELERLESEDVDIDEAVNSEIGLGGDNLKDNIKKLSESLIERQVYKLGWQALNIASRGGIRSGETLVIGALSHNYKTGFTLSQLAALCLYNKFTVKDETKKPLIIHFTFEDKPDTIITFLYKLIMKSFYPEDEYKEGLSLVEMVEIVNKHLTANGVTLQIIDVNPTLWTYKKLFNKIEQFIAKGYEVKVVITDYLEKLPTTGCIASAGTGSDKKDLLRRVRNFMNSKDIAYITPWQLNSSANDLLRNGLPAIQFLKEVAERSYYYGNNTLNTDIDLEFFAHKAVFNKKTYLTIMRGKHRLPGTIPEDDKFFILEFPFPPTMPIPLDVHKEKPIHYRSFSEIGSGNSGGLEMLVT